LVYEYAYSWPVLSFRFAEACVDFVDILAHFLRVGFVGSVDVDVKCRVTYWNDRIKLGDWRASASVLFL
jgi:hypothetical protein